MKFSVKFKCIGIILLAAFISTGDIINRVDAQENPAPAPVQPAKESEVKITKEKDKEKYFTLNFKDADMTEFLNIMSQLIGKNIIIDESVRGKVTITSVKKIPVNQAYEVMKAILEVKGLAVVETKSLIKIVPIADAIKKNSEIIIDGKRQELQPHEEKTVTYLQKIQFADAADISNTLKALKSKFTEIVVHVDLNTIIFSGIRSEIEGLIKIAKALDIEIKEDEKTKEEDKISKGNIHVVHLEYADSEQLAGVLSRIPFSETAKIQTGMPPTQPQQPAPNESKQKSRQSAKSQRTTKNQPVTRPDSTSKLSIIANKDTNSLIITATPEEFKEIYRIIKELDIVREQVLIEALIVEVSAENGWGYGIDWMMGADASGAQGVVGGSQILGTPPDYSTNTVGAKTLAMPLSSGFQIGYLSDKDLLGFILLNASKTDKNYNVLSTPQILTIDNQEAELNVGEEIPVVSNNRVSDTGTQFYTYEYKTVGVKLKITPHITKKNNITLDLYQEVNSVLGSTTVTTSGSVIPPTLGKRDISTKITVSDGKTLVVGGLISNNKTIEETKVPLLGDIPLLGWLFTRRSEEYKKRNLLVFITPYIVTKPEKAEALTKQKKEEQSRLRLK